MKKYSNYAEQVNDNVESLKLFNEINEVDEFYWEPMSEAIDLITTDEEIIENCDLPKDTDITSEEFYELHTEYVMESLESVYQIYKVELKGEFNEEHERLGIHWNDTVEAYIMPVFHFGTAWSYIGAMR